MENEEERHKSCPEVEASWCGWPRHKAGAEDQYIPSDSLPVAIFEVLKPIWRQLTDKVLLQKCLRGATQNRNEAWNGMLWGMCPKTSFVGAEVVKLSAAYPSFALRSGDGLGTRTKWRWIATWPEAAHLAVDLHTSCHLSSWFVVSSCTQRGCRSCSVRTSISRRKHH